MLDETAECAWDVVCRLNLPLCMLYGQFYDAARIMRGERSGVAKRIIDEEPQVVYIHCYGHSVNEVVKTSTMRKYVGENA